MKIFFHKKISGFTLMELLLVTALISVVAAIVTPSFFRNSAETVSQARLAMLKARYFEIRAAIDKQLKDQPFLKTDLHLTVPGTLTNLKKMVNSGHLSANATLFENAAGKSLEFEVSKVAGSLADADLPPALRRAELHVRIVEPAYDLDQALKVDNKSWSQIWKELNP